MTPVSVSAPSKFVVLGEHAVVYGKPAITLATNMRFSMRMSRGNELRVNGRPAGPADISPHVDYLFGIHGNMPVNIFVDGRIPSGSGLGSSAALSVAYSAGLRALEGEAFDRAAIAGEAFDAEYAAQGRGSPMDTSASANGGGIALNVPYKPEDHLWTIEKGGRRWEVSKIDVPEMTFVIGNTGIRAATGPLVDKVGRYRSSSAFASDIVDEIGDIVFEGMRAMRQNDLVELGELMSYDHKLLSILGVSCDELNKLVSVVAPYSYGAKLTGSGGGGCMVALTDKPEKAAEAIRGHGGTPYIVRTGVPGVTVRARGGRGIRSGPRNPRQPWGTSP